MVCNGKHMMGCGADAVETIVMAQKLGINAHFSDDVFARSLNVWDSMETLKLHFVLACLK